MAEQSANTALAVRNDQATMDLAAKCKMMLPYGSKLMDKEAIALAAYSRMYGLDPFYGEAYFLVREKDGKRESIGVHAGIKGLRKKAKEQLREQTGDPSAIYTVEYDEVDAAELHLAANQIAVAVKASLRDENATGRYILEFAKLKHEGVDVDLIREILGKPPMWIGYGAVRTYELGYCKMLPIELAKKRAESAATKLRFDLGWMSLMEDAAPDVIDVDAKDAPASTTPVADIIQERQAAMADKLRGKSENQLIHELGFDTTPGLAPAAAAEPITEGEVLDLSNFWPEKAPFSYAMASTYKASDGKTLYMNCYDDELIHYRDNLASLLKSNTIEPGKRQPLQDRHDVIVLILAAREAMVQAVEQPEVTPEEQPELFPA